MHVWVKYVITIIIIIRTSNTNTLSQHYHSTSWHRPQHQPTFKEVQVNDSEHMLRWKVPSASPQALVR